MSLGKPPPSRRVAVVLFNLGGPDGQADVRPFLFNLFNDPAIIGLPTIVRTPLAALISRRREEEAKANYAHMGGGSPLLAHTQAQARALQASCAARFPDAEVRVFIAMRYWRPFTEEAARDVAAFAPDEVVLLPLYPQFSTTTTGSSLAAWRKAYRGPGKVHAVCCAFEEDGLIEAHARKIVATYAALGKPAPVRLLFSAHGLPEKIIAAGDPYQWQVEQTCARVLAQLGPDWSADWDHQVCYQSRVGPLKWIGPSTPEAIEAAAAAGRGVLVTPIAFVSEHVETLVELDRDYGALARDRGAPFYLRAPAIGTDISYIDGLVEAVYGALGRNGVAPEGRACASGFKACPFNAQARAGAAA